MPIYSDFLLRRYEALIAHRESVPVGARIEVVYQKFKDVEADFMAIVDEGRYVGMVSRADTMTLLSGRYGFALFARRKVEDFLTSEQYRIQGNPEIREVLRGALLDRGPNAFYHDVALLDEDEAYLGMVPAHLLVELQLEIMKEDAEQIEAQRETLDQRNAEILQSALDLRDSEGRWDSVFGHLPLSLAIVDFEGNLVAGNPAFQSTFRAIEHRTIDQLVGEACRESFLERFDACRRRNLSKSYEFELNRDFVENRTLMRTVFARIPETEQIAVIFDDITSEREMEGMIVEKEKSEMIDRLVGGVAHELNNKLSPLLGYLSLGEIGGEDAFDLNEVSGAMREAVQDAATIVRQLRDLSRPPALERVNGNLAEVIHSTLEFLQVEAKRRGCELQVDEGLQLEPVYASFDQSQIRQIFLNLVLNAFDAVDGQAEQVVKIALQAQREGVELIVADNGSGVSPEIGDRIFDSFFTTKADNEGSGLGLSVSRKIARLHDGELRCEASDLGGARFVLRLPRDGGEDEKEALNGDESRKAFAQAGAGLTALVVEDEAFVASFLKSALKTQFGAETFVAENGEVGIEIMKHHAIDFIVSDVRMPRMDGFEFWSWIKQHRPDLTERFLFITGDAGGSVFEEQLQRLGAPVLRKPFAMEDFSSACRGVMLLS